MKMRALTLSDVLVAEVAEESEGESLEAILVGGRALSYEVRQTEKQTSDLDPAEDVQWKAKVDLGMDWMDAIQHLGY